MEEIAIHTATIQLDQLLKWAGIVESGAQVKFLLADAMIEVNGKRIEERRKKIYPGDVVHVKGMGQWQVISE
ncbi:hypothetical protein P22_1844 [Propionispora sp. 2/2-37]|uniref:RNA-binding S4 domain-containing protein n=1 Tax=Propionispora sp. 2/2-37 TaxID=1677858 RepID=UPI0006BB7B61|nr:RNA-binding S4 domain-containing protein [Propionispora sp. 2/2-37]CUH95764.1 hypothetical protein P22_1844 [Propionispora sp. 2/2-37]